jgi:hypothetical protein
VNLEHVFANQTATPTNLGYPVTVNMGTHWLADDPLVKARPDLFTTDCRYGMSWSGEPPHCLSLPPDADLGEDADAGEPIVRGHRRQPAGRP